MRKLLTVAMIWATSLLGPTVIMAEPPVMYQNFQRLMAFQTRVNNNNVCYLVMAPTSMDTDPKRFKMDDPRLHIFLQNSSGQTFSKLGRNQFDLSNLGMHWNRMDTLFGFNLVIDNSGSIDDTNLRIVKDALTTFINELPAPFQGQIIKFSDTVIKSGFTKNKQHLIAWIRKSFDRGSTALFDATAIAVQELKQYGNYVPLKFSVIFTDGYENDSQRWRSDNQATFKKHIQSETQNANIGLFIVGVTDGVDKTLLEHLATHASFGMYKHAKEFGNLKESFKFISDYVKDTYIFSIPSCPPQTNKVLIVKRSKSGRFRTLQDVYLQK